MTCDWTAVVINDVCKAQIHSAGLVYVIAQANIAMGSSSTNLEACKHVCCDGWVGAAHVGGCGVVANEKWLTKQTCRIIVN